jgi:methanethiol S-methyltransferase
MFSRILTFVYGTVSYTIFLATFLYAIGFIGNLIVPKTMDSPAQGPWQTALLVDLGLLGLFAVQHSVMARPWFKRALTRFIPEAAERSTYVLASSLALILMFWQWQPIGGMIWDVQDSTAQAIIYAGYASGWLLILVTTFVINHFDLFGLRQVWRNLLGKDQSGLRFVMPMLYRVVRHPLYVGWFLAFWCTPSMSATHLMFALATTAYILLAIQFEERDLMRMHPEYAEYRKQVPMLVPQFPRTVRVSPVERSGQMETV